MDIAQLAVQLQHINKVERAGENAVNKVAELNEKLRKHHMEVQWYRPDQQWLIVDLLCEEGYEE